MTQLAPGARALIRDEEWLIRRVDPSADGGWLLTCDGISDLVRGQTALFLTALEDGCSNFLAVAPKKEVLVKTPRQSRALKARPQAALTTFTTPRHSSRVTTTTPLQRSS